MNKKIEIVADNFELYQFLNYFVYKNNNGEYFYNNALRHPHIEPLSINFPITNSFEIFDILSWGSWNECPPNKKY